MDDTPQWRQAGDRLTLWYRDYPLVHCDQEDGAVVVRTRAYSEGFQQRLDVATMEGARRYGDAWLAKWGAEAMSAVDSKIHAAAIASQPATGLDALGRPYPEIQVKPRKTRKRSR